MQVKFPIKKVTIPSIWVYWDGGNTPTNNAFYKLEEQAVVDGVNWYSILAAKDITEWLQFQDSALWYLHKSTSMGAGCVITNMFDVHEELYLLIKLKFHG